MPKDSTSRSDTTSHTRASDSSEAPSDLPTVDRRQMLKILGTTGVTVGLAGCSDNDQPGSTPGGGTGPTESPSGGDSPQTDDGDTGGEPVEDTLKIGVGNGFSKPNWNLYNPSQNQPRSAAWLFLQPMYYFRKSSEWKPGLLKDYDFSDTTATFTVDDRFTWHNGDALTSQDFKVQYGIEQYFGNPAWEIIDAIETPDDQTFRLQLTDTVNPDIILFNFFQQTRLQTPRAVFQEYYDKLEEANGESEQSSAKEDLVSFRWTEPIGTGPFAFTSYQSSSEMVGDLYPEYPLADQISVSKALFRSAGKTQQVTADMTNNRIDTRWNLGPAVFNTVKQQGGDNWQTRLGGKPGGRAWVFNADHKWWGDRNVRRGLAYLHNQDQIMRGAPDDAKNKTVPDSIFSYLPPNLAEKYLAGVELEDYGPTESRPEEATSEFEKAGWSKQNGTWHDGNGEEVLFNCKCPAPAKIMQNRIKVMNQMNKEFGLKSELNVVEGSSYWDSFSKGNFPVQWFKWGGDTPAAAFQKAIVGQVPREQFHVPAEIEVPEIGDVGGENAMTVNTDDQLLNITRSQSESDIEQAIQTLAWTANQFVPTIPNQVGNLSPVITVDDWEWPGEDDPLWSTPSQQSYAWSMGKAGAKMK